MMHVCIHACVEGTFAERSPFAVAFELCVVRGGVSCERLPPHIMLCDSTEPASAKWKKCSTG